MSLKKYTGEESTNVQCGKIGERSSDNIYDVYCPRVFTDEIELTDEVVDSNRDSNTGDVYMNIFEVVVEGFQEFGKK